MNGVGVNGYQPGNTHAKTSAVSKSIKIYPDTYGPELENRMVSSYGYSYPISFVDKMRIRIIHEKINSADRTLTEIQNNTQSKHKPSTTKYDFRQAEYLNEKGLSFPRNTLESLYQNYLKERTPINELNDIELLKQKAKLMTPFFG